MYCIHCIATFLSLLQLYVPPTPSQINDLSLIIIIVCILLPLITPWYYWRMIAIVLENIMKK